MKLGYSTWGMPTVPMDVAIPYLANLGFQGTELTVLKRWITELSTLDAAKRKEIRELAQRHRFEIDSVYGHNSLLADDPDDVAYALSRCRGAADLCADLATGSQVPGLVILPGGKPEDWRPKREMLVERVGEVVDYCARRGVVLALEPHVSSMVDSVERIQWLFDKIRSKSFSLNFDISHFEVQGIPMEVTIPALSPLSSRTHVKDERGRAPNHEFLIPGEGEFDYVKYLKLMRAAGYDGYVTVEMSVMVQRRPSFDPLEAAAQSYRTLDAAFREAGISRG